MKIIIVLYLVVVPFCFNAFGFETQSLECSQDSDCFKLGVTAYCRLRKYACGPACTAARKVCVMDDWSICEQDDDCVDIHFSCAGATVNKRYTEVATKFYSDKNVALKCNAPVVDEKKNVPFKVFCKEKKCSKQGNNPKIGISVRLKDPGRPGL